VNLEIQYQINYSPVETSSIYLFDLPLQFYRKICMNYLGITPRIVQYLFFFLIKYNTCSFLLRIHTNIKLHGRL